MGSCKLKYFVLLGKKKVLDFGNQIKKFLQQSNLSSPNFLTIHSHVFQVDSSKYLVRSRYLIIFMTISTTSLSHYHFTDQSLFLFFFLFKLQNVFVCNMSEKCQVTDDLGFKMMDERHLV